MLGEDVAGKGGWEGQVLKYQYQASSSSSSRLIAIYIFTYLQFIKTDMGQGEEELKSRSTEANVLIQVSTIY